MKKLFVLLIALMMVFALVACDNNGDTPGGNTDNPGTSQGGENNNGGEENNGSGTEIKDITADNWAEVVSENFGLDLTLPDGWSVKEVSSPNGTSNVKLFFNVGGDATYTTFGETLFAELKKDAVGDITKYMDSSTVYSSFADAQATPGIASFTAKLTESEYGKDIVINYYDNKTNVEITIQRGGNWD